MSKAGQGTSMNRSGSLRAVARPRGVRGYSIVELTIVLVAGALLASGPILLIQNKVLQDNYDSVARQLEVIRFNVADYAASHRTVERHVEVAGTVHALPGGRPYLPCPDVTGDGIEDRMGLTIPQTVTVAPGAAIGSAEGQCVSSLGWLPHATLGSQPADPWGNRLVYRVDMVMSNC